MAQQAVVYGRIQEAWEGTAERWPIVPTYNSAALTALPDTDEDWPFLTRHMFSVTEPPLGGSAERGIYRGRLIHFAAAIKDDQTDLAWPETFLAKLEERVLARLLWVSARVHFESAFQQERSFLYLSERDSIWQVLSELRTGRFGERVEAAVRWTRTEATSGNIRPTWLS